VFLECFCKIRRSSDAFRGRFSATSLVALTGASLRLAFVCCESPQVAGRHWSGQLPVGRMETFRKYRYEAIAMYMTRVAFEVRTI
jgi:hypothetical protein